MYICLYIHITIVCYYWQHSMRYYSQIITGTYAVPYMSLQTPWRPGSGPPPPKVSFLCMSLQTPWGPGGGPPPPKMLPSISSPNIKSNVFERRPKKPRFDQCVTMSFHIFTKQLKGSQGRYAHSGIRVRPKTGGKNKFGKTYLSELAAQTRRQFFRKSRFFVFGGWHEVGMF